MKLIVWIIAMCLPGLASACVEFEILSNTEFENLGSPQPVRKSLGKLPISRSDIFNIRVVTTIDAPKLNKDGTLSGLFESLSEPVTDYEDRFSVEFSLTEQAAYSLTIASLNFDNPLLELRRGGELLYSATMIGDSGYKTMSLRFDSHQSAMDVARSLAASCESAGDT